MADWSKAVTAADQLHDSMLAIAVEVGQYRQTGDTDAATDIKKVLPSLQQQADLVRDTIADLAGALTGIDE